MNQPRLHEPLLELRAVTCERDDAPLFAPLSFELRGGEIVQIEGANGVGKTTLLRCIGGLSSRWQGEMLWCGKSLARHRAEFAAATIYLGHALGLKAALSARENLQWWASLRGIDIGRTDNGRRDEIDAALARVGLDGYEETACYQMSAGQQRRVGLARLFLSDARSDENTLWILDEPFTAIDRAGVAQLEQWLAEHAANGGAVLLTSHQALSLPQVRALELRVATAEAEV